MPRPGAPGSSTAPGLGAAPADRSAGLNGWSRAAMVRGLQRYRVWLSCAGKALLLEPNGYRAIACDATMNAPALLLGIFFAAFSVVIRSRRVDFVLLAAAIVVWLVMVAAVFGAARLLKGQGDFSGTLRVMGFARVGEVLMLLTFVPELADIAGLAAAALTFMGVWIGTAEAHRLRGWRSVAIPVAALLVLVGAISAFLIMTASAQLTVTSLLQTLGISHL